MRNFGLIILVVVGVWYFWPDSEEWKGFLYPNAADLTSHIETGLYESLEDCRNATLRMADRVNISEENGFDYECGLNCSPEPGYGDIEICEKTEQ